MRHNLALNHVEEIFKISQGNLTVVSKNTEAANQPFFTKKRPRRRSKQKFNIDVESFLALPSCHVYWKNCEGQYIGCNDLQAKNMSLNKNSEVIGKTDFDFYWKNVANIYWDNDQEVIGNNSPKIACEPMRLADGSIEDGISYKIPLLSADGASIGVFGLSFRLTEKSSVYNYYGLLGSIGMPHAVPQREVKIDNTRLSKREIECLYYLVRGMSAKQIANQLTLSYRTVEYYFERMKDKLSCDSRSELIAKIIDAGFASSIYK